VSPHTGHCGKAVPCGRIGSPSHQHNNSRNSLSGMSVRNALLGKAHSQPVAMGPFWQANLVCSRTDPLASWDQLRNSNTCSAHHCWVVWSVVADASVVVPLIHPAKGSKFGPSCAGKGAKVAWRSGAWHKGTSGGTPTDAVPFICKFIKAAALADGWMTCGSEVLSRCLALDTPRASKSCAASGDFDRSTPGWSRASSSSVERRRWTTRQASRQYCNRVSLTCLSGFSFV